MNICDTNLFGNGLLYVTFNQDQGKPKATHSLNSDSLSILHYIHICAMNAAICFDALTILSSFIAFILLLNNKVIIMIFFTYFQDVLLVRLIMAFESIMLTH